MYHMFRVRSARALLPICTRALPCTPLAPRSPATSGLPVLCTSPRTICPPFDSRQYASAFNQPLSFDTSSVTDMGNMFYVRSYPCPAPNLQSSSPPLHTACTAIARRLPPPGTLLRAPHRMPSFLLSAESVGVQPAAELRHLARHRHVQHVLRALLPVPCSHSAVEPSPARCLHAVAPAASRLQARISLPIVCPPFDSRQAARAFNQPLSFDTSSVTDMQWMFGVRSARALWHPSLQVGSSPCVARLRCYGPHTLPPSVLHLAPLRMLCIQFGRPRMRSTSR